MPGQSNGEEGRYLYCVANSGGRISFGEIGLNDNEVYTVPHKDICAVVHKCPAEPYDSNEEEEIKEWVKTHQGVLDRIMKDSRFSSLVPAGFDTIIRSKGDHSASENLRRWLEKDHDSLLQQLEKVKNMEEYGVRVIYEPGWLENNVSKDSEEFRSLQKKIDSKDEGAAYLYREKLTQLTKDKIEKKKEKLISEFCELVEPTVAELKREEVTERESDKKILMNLSCLVAQGEYEELGSVLEKIDSREGFNVKFTGPWAPFSFTQLRKGKDEA